MAYDADLTITKIITVRKDTIYPKFPYIETVPRTYDTIVYFIDGGMYFTVNGSTLLFRAGDVGFIEKGYTDINEAAFEQPVDFIFASFETYGDLPQMPIRPQNSVKDPSAYLSDLTEAERLWNLQPLGYVLHCKEILYRIFARLLLESLQTDKTYFKHKQIEKAVTYIRQHYNNSDTSVDMLADLCAMSASNLRRLFLNLYRMTPGQYLTHTRIENAKELLLTTSGSIGEIAEKIGYADIYGFSRAFKRNAGQSPSQWLLNKRSKST